MATTSVTIDKAAIRDASRLLQSYQGAAMEKRLQRATLAGVNALKGPLRSATPRGRTGNLASSIKVRRVREGRKRGARFLGYTVGPGGKNGRHRFMVVGGTKPHIILGAKGKPLGLPFGPRAMVRHPGAKANPYVERAGNASEGRAVAAFLAVLRRP